jgi:hypothetical protein
VVEIGDDETTCIIEWQASKAGGNDVKQGWSKWLSFFRVSMATALIDHGAEIRPYGSEGPRVRAVGSGKVRAEFVAAYPAEAYITGTRAEV